MFGFFTHYPSRVLQAGGGVLGGFALFAGFFMLPILSQPPLPFPRGIGKTEETRSLAPLLAQDLQPRSFAFDAAQLEERILLALCPSRPDHAHAGPVAHVKIKGSNQNRQVALPGKAGLYFNERGELCLGEENGRFWLELELQDGGVFSASVFLEYEEEIRSARFRKTAILPLVQKMEELFHEEPFQTLSKARWLGTDLVCKAGLGEAIQKIEIGSSVLDISDGGKIFWDGSRWIKALSSAEGMNNPLVQVRSSTGQALELDVWDGLGDRHMRVSSPITGLPQTRIKAEEWFSSVRIRSDKQISCLLEKQCLVLREGDWILKENGRWRVLRKEEDKQQMIEGKRAGDLLLLELIDAKRRVVQGRLILANRVHGFHFSLTIAAKSEKKLSAPRARGAS